MFQPHITFGVAFAAGLLTFVAPCVLPVLPAYLGYISGVSMMDAQARPQNWRRRAFLIGLSFVVGFLLIFVLLGIGATGIGLLLTIYRRPMQVIGGLLFILLGAHLAGLIQIRFLDRSRQVKLDKGVTRWQYLNAFLIGLTFGFSWTPCIGPVLGVILFWASQEATFWRGFFLLLSFGLGLGLPFLLLSLLAEHLIKPLRKYGRLFYYLQITAGVFVLVIGLLLVTNMFSRVVSPLTRFGTLELWLAQ